MDKTFKQITTAVIAAAVMAAGTLTALAARTPDPEGQNKINWCWAAAAKIVAEHNGGANPEIDRNPQLLTDTNTDNLKKSYYGIIDTNSSRKYTADGVQYAIVTHVTGDDGNYKGSDLDRNNALQYASAKTMDVGCKGSATVNITPELIEEINTDLLGGKYVLANMITTNSNIFHSVVIKSYNEQNNTYIVFDPWNKTEINYRAATIFSDFTFQFTTDKYGNMIYGKVNWFNYCR